MKAKEEICGSFDIVGDILAMYNVMHPVLYYAIDESVERGMVLWVEKTAVRVGPEFIVIHPESLERVKEILRHRRLLPLREYMPTLDDVFVKRAMEVEG